MMASVAHSYSVRQIAAVLFVGIALIGMFGVAQRTGPTFAHDGCERATTACTTSASTMTALPETAPPASAEHVPALPCLHDPGCGGGGLALASAAFATLLMVLLLVPPRCRPQLMGVPRRVHLFDLLLARHLERPPRLAVTL